MMVRVQFVDQVQQLLLTDGWMFENRLARDSCGRGKWESHFKKKGAICSFIVAKWGLHVLIKTVCFFPHRHQLQLVSCSGRRSDWLGFLPPEPHSGGVSGGRLKPISPRQPGPPLESAGLVSFPRWSPPPVWELGRKKKTWVRGRIVCTAIRLKV